MPLYGCGETSADRIRRLPTILDTFVQFNITDYHENIAEYEIVADENGVLYSYPGLLIRDGRGIWKFRDF